MPLIAWTPSLSVKVKELDEQHQLLVHYINELHDQAQNGANPTFVARLLNGLMHYTEDHFSTEERYFKATDYPDYTAHVKEHEGFFDQVKHFQKQLEEGQNNLVLPLMKFLSDWLITHIQESDMAYVPFLINDPAPSQELD